MENREDVHTAVVALLLARLTRQPDGSLCASESRWSVDGFSMDSRWFLKGVICWLHISVDECVGFICGMCLWDLSVGCVRWMCLWDVSV